jgi:hypothetical protein
MMATKSLIIMMLPTKPLDSNMLGKPWPISTIIGNIILRYNSWLLTLIFHLLMVNVKILILRTIFYIHIINIFCGGLLPFCQKNGVQWHGQRFFLKKI